LDFHPQQQLHARRRSAITDTLSRFSASEPCIDGSVRVLAGVGLAPRLTITCSSVGPSWVLVLRGSLDAGSVIALRSQFDQLASGEFDHVIVDVSDVTVIDHFGAAALGVLGERAAVIGAELRLRHRGCTVSAAGGLCPPPTVAAG